MPSFASLPAASRLRPRRLLRGSCGEFVLPHLDLLQKERLEELVTAEPAARLRSAGEAPSARFFAAFLRYEAGQFAAAAKAWASEEGRLGGFEDAARFQRRAGVGALGRAGARARGRGGCGERDGAGRQRTWVSDANASRRLALCSLEIERLGGYKFF